MEKLIALFQLLEVDGFTEMVKSAEGIVQRAEEFRGTVRPIVLEIEFVDEEGKPLPNAKYALILPDGTERYGITDKKGILREKNIPDGIFSIRLVEGGFIVHRG